jgi:putative ABC transport system permease protein
LPVLLDLLIAGRNLRRNGRRTLIAIASVAFGVAALILAGGFIDWNLEFGRESTIRSQLGHIQVRPRGASAAAGTEPFVQLLPGKSQAMQRIAAEPWLRALGPRLSFSGLVSHGDSTLSFVGEGVLPSAEAELSTAMTFVEGRPLAEDEPRAVVLGKGLAANLGVSVDDQVILVANTAAGAINAVECRVRGVFRTITKAYDDVALRVPISTARELLRTEGAHVWVLLLDRTETTPLALAQLRSQFSSHPLEFVPWTDMADFYKKTAALFGKQVLVVKIIIAMIIVLSVSSTLMMNVMERTGEIGTALALGVRRSQLMRQFLFEGALVGLLGGAVGLGTGALLAQVISRIGIPMPPPPGMDHGYVAGIALSAGLLSSAFVVATAPVLLAAVYPAWSASRKSIVQALRHNR